MKKIFILSSFLMLFYSNISFAVDCSDFSIFSHKWNMCKMGKLDMPEIGKSETETETSSETTTETSSETQQKHHRKNKLCLVKQNQKPQM